MDPLKKKKLVVIVILAIVILIAIGALIVGVMFSRNKSTSAPSPVVSSTVATGPGSVAWEASCIYTKDLQVAEKDPLDVCNLNLLSQNLTAIPPAVFTMTNLEYLDLANNNITSVPSDIGNLTHLKWLYLNQNPISSLPDSMNQLTDLQLLAVEEDDITALPSDMVGMANLQVIVMKGDPLPPPEVSRIRAAFTKVSLIY